MRGSQRGSRKHLRILGESLWAPSGVPRKNAEQAASSADLAGIQIWPEVSQNNGSLISIGQRDTRADEEDFQYEEEEEEEEKEE